MTEIKPIHNCHILVVDDEPDIGMIFTKILNERGYTVCDCRNAEEALSLVQSKISPKMIFLDIRLPGMDGISALSKFLQINPSVPVIMMTGYQTIESVVASIKAGAIDYIVKPLDPMMIMQAVQKYFSSNVEGGLAIHKVSSLGVEFAASTPAMKAILMTAAQFALADGAILILGDSGTGKEVLAHFIHQRSKRNGDPFVTVDCASLPESLFESELFGYEKGAFTGADYPKVGRFELANKGTLFLDEIANIPLTMQTKLLRFIENHSITRLGGRKTVHLDIRLIAATNADLKKMVETGSFREDLYYRISALTIHLPPLRNRPREEKEFLTDYFIQKNAELLRKPLPTMSPVFRQAILDYPWPGNVRELENVLYCAILLCNSNILDLEHLPVGIQSYCAHHEEQITAVPGVKDKSLREVLKRIEREQIFSALNRTEGNKKKASEILDMDYKSFLSKLKEYSQEDPQL